MHYMSMRGVHAIRDKANASSKGAVCWCHTPILFAKKAFRERLAPNERFPAKEQPTRGA